MTIIFFFCAELIDGIVDEYVLHFDSLHGKKHSFLFGLHSYMSSCTDLVRSDSVGLGLLVWFCSGSVHLVLIRFLTL